MKIKCIIALICSAILSFPAGAAIITDGDFSLWNLGAIGTATTSLELTGGNPDARLNITTVSGAQVYGIAVKSDYSTSLSLEDTAFTLRLDVLSGPDARNEGQRIYLLVEQNSSVYGTDLGITGFPLNWDTLSFTGSFVATSFPLLSGSGPAFPDFSGGVDTSFGFSGSNSNSRTLTQYYDNFYLETSAVPIPPAIWLFGSGLMGIVGVARRKVRA